MITLSNRNSLLGKVVLAKLQDIKIQKYSKIFIRLLFNPHFEFDTNMPSLLNKITFALSKLTLIPNMYVTGLRQGVYLTLQYPESVTPI